MFLKVIVSNMFLTVGYDLWWVKDHLEDVLSTMEPVDNKVKKKTQCIHSFEVQLLEVHLADPRVKV